MSARRPDVITNLIARGLYDLCHLSIGDGDDENLSIFVRERDPLAVSRPFGLITHGAAASRQLLRQFRSVLRHQIQFLLAAKIRDKSDLRSVGSPGGPLVVGAG